MDFQMNEFLEIWNHLWVFTIWDFECIQIICLETNNIRKKNRKWCQAIIVFWMSFKKMGKFALEINLYLFSALDTRTGLINLHQWTYISVEWDILVIVIFSSHSCWFFEFFLKLFSILFHNKLNPFPAVYFQNLFRFFKVNRKNSRCFTYLFGFFTAYLDTIECI